MRSLFCISFELSAVPSDRDWGRYNEALVRRGGILLDFSVMDEWKRELKKVNEGKVGGQYRYLKAFIRLLAFVRLYFHLPYRQTEGFVRAMARHVKGLKAPDYSTIDRRANKLDLSLEDTFIRSVSHSNPMNPFRSLFSTRFFPTSTCSNNFYIYETSLFE
jgi:hypothetical protein